MSNRKGFTGALRAGIAALAVGASVVSVPGIASADASDDYPIPNRILKTTCTVTALSALLLLGCSPTAETGHGPKRSPATEDTTATPSASDLGPVDVRGSH